VLADLVQVEGTGITVPPGDALAVSAAIETLLDPESAAPYRARIATVADRYSWDRVAEPLLRYCREPVHLGERRGDHSGQRYLHDLERLYTETAQYARELETVVAEKNRALEEQASGRRLPGQRMIRRLRRHG
jgi:hypothetical protein